MPNGGYDIALAVFAATTGNVGISNIYDKEKKMKVSFQGELGAYSEQAIYKFFGQEAEVVPCQTFADLFDRVSDGAAEFGVAPVENSTAGTIVPVYDLLLEHDLHVVGEIKFRVVHCLISFAGTKLEEIKKIYTHPQAWAQCSTFCRQYPWEYVPSYDTAGSVKIIKQGNLQNAAAIASSRAAEIYGMEVLRPGIESHNGNVTRFFVVSREVSSSSGSNKISLAFATRNEPGALYECLGEFAGQGINLTKIESRPRLNRPWEYVFYLDLEGNLDDKVCVQAVSGLLKRAAFVKILGSYRAAL